MQNRINAFFNSLPKNVEAVLIKSQENRFYFLNFDAGDAGTLVLLRDKGYYIIDSRYIEIAKAEVKHFEVMLENKAFEQTKDILQKHGITTLNIETEISLACLDRITKAMNGITIDTTDIVSSTIEKLRMIKDAHEVACIRKAQAVTDACFLHIQPFIKAGVREIDIALEMEVFMRRNGADAIAFPTILVAGKKTSLPHGEPGNNIIQEGDFVTMDFGAKVGGYCSDMTRTVAVGKITDEQKKVYDTVLQAQLAACNGAKAGMSGAQIDKIARDIIYNAGYEGCFGHGLGHSLGIQIHENPRFSVSCNDIIQAGTMMTIEPGIYLEGKFGVRIEDTVLVNEDGIEILGNSDKNLIIL